MANIRDRVVRLETRLNTAIDHAQMMEDAAEVTKRLLNSAAGFDETASSMPLAERLAMSPAQHCAWAIRFAPEQADPVAIMAFHAQN